MQAHTTYTAHLSDRTVLKVSGADARDFLNGLVTADIEALADGGRCHAGLLSPQGKILFEFFIIRDGNTFWIDTSDQASDDLSKRLGFYKLRADVAIEPAEDHCIMAVWNGDSDDAADPRLHAMGNRYVVVEAAMGAKSANIQPATLDDYHAHRIARGIPESIKDYPLGDTFPHEACFDQLNGVSFTKGCFVGQEVVSRMRHRGTARKRTIQVTADGPLPSPETPVLADDRPIGALGSSNGTTGIAMIRLDRAAKAMAAGTPITADGVALRLNVPDWADFQIAGKPKEETQQ